MKLQQLEYVIAIAHTGSITTAAKNLYQAQPNISIALKELESEIGMQIFWRTPNGMILTPEGESFLLRAKDIVESMHSLENDYTNRGDEGVSLKISSVRSVYVPYLLSLWINKLDDTEKLSLRFYETNSNKVIEDVNSGKSDIGIIRIPFSKYEMYEEQLTNRKLAAIPFALYNMMPIMSADHPLAGKEEVTIKELEQYPKIVHADDEMNVFERTYINSEYEDVGSKRICVQDNGSKMLFLRNVKDAYMWVSPSPAKLARKDGAAMLKIVKCSDSNLKTLDILICKKSNESSRTIKACMDFLVENAAMIPGVSHFDGKSVEE